MIRLTISTLLQEEVRRESIHRNSTGRPSLGLDRLRMPRTSQVSGNFLPNFLLKTNACFLEGGNVRVVTQKLEWNVKSKIGSLDNVKHVAGGGNVKIFDEKYTSNNGSQKSGCSTPSTTPRTPQPQQQQQIDQLLNDTQQKLRIN